MRVWVTRDNGSINENVIYVRTQQPQKMAGAFYGLILYRFDRRAFKKKHGFTPRKGSCKQMELSLSEIE